MSMTPHILPEWHEASRLALLRLPQLVAELYARHGAIPHFGCELEWYVTPIGDMAAFHAEVERAAKAEALAITPIRPESGKGQYETGFDVTTDAAALAESINAFRALLMRKAADHGLTILWDAKPYPQDYGSALQLHLHLTDDAGNRLYVKREAELSPMLAASIGGLLAVTPEAMRVAAPQPASYARFVAGFDAPVNICWGGNNRSTTLRLPLKTGPECHIEYRLAGADADAASMLGVMLAGVLDGLARNLPAGVQMHGVASHAQYGLPPLPESAAIAERAFNSAVILPHWLGDAWYAAVGRSQQTV